MASKLSKTMPAVVAEFEIVARPDPLIISASLYKGNENFSIRHSWKPEEGENAGKTVPTKFGITVRLSEVLDLIEASLDLYNEVNGTHVKLAGIQKK